MDRRVKWNSFSIFVVVLMFIAAAWGCNNPLLDIVKDKVTEFGKSSEILVKQDANTIPSGSGSYDFAITGTDREKEITFTIINLGETDLILENDPAFVQVSGGDSSYFTVTSQPSSPISPGSSENFTLGFIPTEVRNYTAAVTIANNISGSGAYTFTTTGRGEYCGIQTVYSSGDVGNYVSIAVSGDYVYISYYDDTNDNLRFARSANGGKDWDGTSTIDTVVYPSGDVGKFSSIAVEAGNIYISYYDDTNDYLRFARSTDGGQSWDTDPTIDTLVDNRAAVGEFSSLAAGGGNIFISYYNRTSKDLKIAKSEDEGVSWTLDVYNDYLENNLAVGQSTSITTDGNYAYVSYQDEVDYDYKLKFVKDYFPFMPFTVDSRPGDPSPGFSTSICLEGSDVYISYYTMLHWSSCTGEIAFVKSIDSGNHWGTPYHIDASNYCGFSDKNTSIALGASNIYISYPSSESTPDGFKLAISADKSGGTWSTVTVDDTTNLSGFWSSVAATGDMVYLAYYNEDTGDLKFAKSIDCGQTW
jgi:archaellum component FlaG (FlaF/FlaG flagellin family)